MNCLNPFSGKRDFAKDIQLIRAFSEKIEKRISITKIPNDSKIDKFSLEELQDLNKILGFADFLLYKYEEKKETHSILQNFVSIIVEYAESIEGMDDEISELILSAEDSIGKVKEIHTRLSEKSDIAGTIRPNPLKVPESSSINLTNSSTEVNPLEYQQNFQEEDAQVI